MVHIKDFPEKLKVIYLPFLLIAFCFILAYTFLHWLLIISGISVREIIITFVLPFCLPWIPVYIWLRPRIRILDFKNDNASFLMQFLAVFAICFSTTSLQNYLIQITGELTHLEYISQYAENPKTKYYTLKKYYIDKKNIIVRPTASVSGKYGQNFNMRLYVAMPLIDSIGTAVSISDRYWLAKKYSQTISNRLSESEKRERYDSFARSSEIEFENTNFRKFTYLEVIGNNEDRDEFKEALKNFDSDVDEHIFFFSKNEPFETRTGNKLFWVFGILGIFTGIIFIFLLFVKFNKHRLRNFKKGKLPRNDDWKDSLVFITPRAGYSATPIILSLNVLIFFLMAVSGLGFISFQAADVLSLGANFRPYTANGQWWRLFSSMFLHGGIVHLAVNMFSLLLVGIFLEARIGTQRFLFVYFLTGFCASIASVWWHEATVSVGASGAIFGLYGFFLSCLFLKVFSQGFTKAFLGSTLIFIGFNLVMGLAGNIDNAAHIGGLLSGLILGYFMSGYIEDDKNNF